MSTITARFELDPRNYPTMSHIMVAFESYVYSKYKGIKIPSCYPFKAERMQSTAELWVIEAELMFNENTLSNLAFNLKAYCDASNKFYGRG